MKVQNKGGITMNTWIIPCNIKYFDLFTHFENTDWMLWKGVSKTSVGDIVYLYLGSPYSEIRYKCRVSEINVNQEEVKKSGIDLLLKETKNRKNMIRIQLQKVFPEKLFGYWTLKEHGLVSVQSQMRISKELQDYLSSHE